MMLILHFNAFNVKSDLSIFGLLSLIEIMEPLFDH